MFDVDYWINRLMKAGGKIVVDGQTICPSGPGPLRRRTSPPRPRRPSGRAAQSAWSATQVAQSRREPAKVFRSTWPEMPGTRPVPEYCQKAQDCASG